VDILVAMVHLFMVGLMVLGLMVLGLMDLGLMDLGLMDLGLMVDLMVDLMVMVGFHLHSFLHLHMDHTVMAILQLHMHRMAILHLHLDHMVSLHMDHMAIPDHMDRDHMGRDHMDRDHITIHLLMDTADPMGENWTKSLPWKPHRLMRLQRPTARMRKAHGQS